jgi:hypothetical protein
MAKKMETDGAYRNTYFTLLGNPKRKV